MRQLTSRSLVKGFTLIELMIGLAILGVLTMAALPDLSGYVANSKMREGASTILAAAATARTEALRRNCSISMSVSGNAITLDKESNCPSSSLSAKASGLPRTLNLPNGVSASLVATDGTAAAKAVFSSAGQINPFGTAYSVSTTLANKACSQDIRCPVVLIEAGGAANVCAKGAVNGACV